MPPPLEFIERSERLHERFELVWRDLLEILKKSLGLDQALLGSSRLSREFPRCLPSLHVAYRITVGTHGHREGGGNRIK